MRMVKILIVDDHPLTRAGVALVVAKEFPKAQCREAATLGAMQELLEAESWSLVLLDHNLSDGKGIEYLASHPKMPPTLVLTMYEDRELSRQARDAGARGFVSKGDDPQEIVTAIRTVLGLGLHFPKLEAKADELTLSVRERELLEALLQGQRPAEIARRWNVGQTTVQSYKSRLFVKYGVSSLADLVKAAVAKGII